MNNVILVGRLAKDPDLRSTPTGKSVATFSVAVDRKFTQDGGQTADFINCVAWGKTGEIISQYMSKGRQIALEGRLQTRTYDGKNGKVFITEVVVDSFDFVGDKSSSDSTKKKEVPKMKEQQDTLDDLFLASDDDLPF